VGGTASITSGNATICKTFTAPTITLVGSTGTIQWQSSLTSGGTFSDIAGQTSAILPSASISNTTTKYYRAKVTSGVCTEDYSNEILVTVDPTSKASTQNLSPQTICINTTPTAITLTNPVGTIQWQVSTTIGGTYTDMVGQTSATLPISSISNTATQYYKAVVTSGVCASDNAIATVNVDPTSVGGTASITSGNATICKTFTAPSIKLVGNTGTIQWESSSTSGTGFTPIVGQTSAILPSASISNTTTKYYRAKVTSGVCTQDYSNEILVTVSPTSYAGAPSPLTQTICINTTPTAITLTSPVGTIQWQSAAIIGGTYTDMVGETSATLPAASISNTASQYYKAVVTSGVCASDNAIATVNVNPDNTIALISNPGTTNQKLCINNPIIDIIYRTSGATNAKVDGLPIGMTQTWSNNVFTINGRPSESGSFLYTVTLQGGCSIVTSTGLINVIPDNTITLSSAEGTDAQSLCINTAITSITYTTTGATGARVDDLPAGVTYKWIANVLTITGSPTVAGVYTYTVTLTGGCGVITKKGSIISKINTVVLSSALSTISQTKCINTAITNITYNTTGATGATVSGLPAGVTYNWVSNVLTISGTPTVSGAYSYLVTLTGGCSVVTTTGLINVTPDNTITLSSAVGTDGQALCISTGITNITYTTTGATGATVSGLPAGVTYNWASNVLTISGTPTVSGVYNYIITLSGGCGIITKTGSIISKINTVVLSSAASTINQTICINTAITNITYNTTVATGAKIDGLPAGVTYNWVNDVLTISGTPTIAGTYNYIVTLTGGCSVITTTGIIKVTPDNTIKLSSLASTINQTLCVYSTITNITYATTGATGAIIDGLPAGVTYNWASNVLTISGSPKVSGIFTYTVTLTGGCGLIKASGNININALPNVVANSNVPALCFGETLILYGSGASTYTWDLGVIDKKAFIPKNTAKYYVKGIDLNGCENIASIIIKVNPLPIAEDIKAKSNKLMETASMDLNAFVFLGTPPFRYYWNTDANLSSNKSNTSLLNVVGVTPGKSAVTFYVIDANGCRSELSLPFNIEIIPLSMKFEFPNAFMPTADFITNRVIKPSFNFAVKSVNYFKIFNRMGQLVYEVSNVDPSMVNWDGKVNGTIQVADVYVWIAEYTGLGKTKIEKKSGQFLLLK
jgi:hypothetical protein